ncbi:protein singed wings 2 isoform X1 [Plutella xylostella]|uniref:protein singed wings 2 isoform X1 n=1 Tax=Plutella xylostella TaxID=51655 RepID=UPI0020321AB1|nr:protein singed wings 2 isoform X1 [Plutella xylostella]
MQGSQVWQFSIVLSLAVLVTPGLHYDNRTRTNETAILLSRPCTLMEFVHTAQCFQTQFRLLCKGGITGEWIKGFQEHITELSVLEWPGACFNVARLQEHFPELRHLALVNCSHLTYFKGHFGPTSRIEKLSFHGLTSLWELPGEVIAQMPKLREMDLRHNVLRHMKAKLLRSPPRLQKVYLGGNKWDCSDGGLDWLAMERDDGTVKRLIADYRDLMCHQQLYRGKPLHKVMDIIRSVRQTCPPPCACAMTHVVSDRAGNIIPLITVNCSSQGLEAPPASLPPSTTTLRLEANKINTIRTILQNHQYKKLADLYLDNNSIPSVKELEGSEWFSTFRVLSLRGNLLRQIPVYAFDKAFQSNNNIMQVHLGHNPWRCDCHFIPRFQALLLKYKRVIHDLKDIRCSKSDDKETSLVQISTMSLGSVCTSTKVRVPLSTINVVNLVLCALILLVLGRFLYDWHLFKTTGKLPWISSILP